LITKTIIIICACISITAVSGYADEFESCRCANGLASRGDSKEEVLQECGKPVAKHSRYKRIRGSRLYVEEWVYNFGPNEFMQAINFDRDGRVLSVTSLGYGS
jgi:hypothetical protein